MSPSPKAFLKTFCHSIRVTALWSLPVFLVFFLFIRAWKNEENYGAYSNCAGCFWIPTLAHDLWLAALFFVLFGLGYALSDRRFSVRLLKFLFRLSGVLILIIIAADFMVGDILQHRFLWTDFLRFSGDAESGFSVALAWFAPPYGKYKAIAVFLFIAAALTACFSGKQHKKMAMAWIVLAALCFSASFVMSKFPVRYVHENVVWNVLEANRPDTRTRRVSEEFLRAAVKKTETLAQVCEQRDHPSAKTNFIILMLESWSSWQSQLFGGDEDWTPLLDGIARKNHYFTRFYANGFTTLGGEIAIILGAHPLPAEGESALMLSDFRNESAGIPYIARQTGHQSAFITTSDLSFLSLGDWLRNIRFDVIEGSRHPFYEGMKRWQFDAPEDTALYARFLQWLDRRDAEKPFIAVMLTVSSHPPFINPENGVNDFEGTFRYVDKQAAHFYESLKKRGFFNDGVLLIIGDHRTMSPLRRGEYEKYGERSFARVPMIVAGNVEMPKVVTEPFQQTDIAPSIADFLGLEVCFNPFMGNFLKKEPSPPEYILHMRGDERDRVDVYYGENAVSGYRLAGDESRWLEKPPPNSDMVSAWITTQRFGTRLSPARQ